MSDGRAARRAVVRWAWRLFRRELRQQVLVLALLTVAVGAAVAGSTIAAHAPSDATGRSGTAGMVLTLDASDAANAAAGIAAARQAFGPIEVIARTTVAIPGSVERLDVVDQDPHGTFGSPMLALLHGRFPAADREVALTPRIATLFEATVGSRIGLGAETMVVVGIVENPGGLSADLALVMPGSVTDPRTFLVLADPPGRDGRMPDPVPAQVQISLANQVVNTQAITASVLAATAMAMAMVGLVAAAAFVVIAHRRRRQLGLLTAIGATDRHVRMVMIANGAIVGLVGALAGTALGIGAWMLTEPAIETAADHRIDRFALPWMTIAWTAILAIVMGTVAAWWPARSASRRPVMAAIAGRPTPPQPVHRSLLVAVVLVAGGLTMIARSSARSADVDVALLVAGLLATVLGAVFVAPSAVRLLGVVARRLPLAPRLALRDLARYQARAAAALAAIILGIAIAVSVIGIAGASGDRNAVGNLSSSELLIRIGDVRTAPSTDRTAAQVAALDAKAAVVAAAAGQAAPVPLDVAFAPARADGRTNVEPVSIGVSTEPHSLEFGGYPYVATPALMALYDIDAAAIDAPTELIAARTTGLQLIDAGERSGMDGQRTITQQVPLPDHGAAPHALITTAEMVRTGWTPARAAWIVESDRPLAPDAIAAARRAAAVAGLQIETRSSPGTLSALRTGATLVGGVLALAIIAMAVSLIRGESAGDVRTLTATGASRATRRALVASTAGALAVLGVVLGMGGAYLALVATFHSELWRLVPVPVTELLALGVGLPLVAAAAGWLLAGRDPRAFAHQRLD